MWSWQQRWIKAVSLPNPDFVRLDLRDGTWAQFRENWRTQCESFGEDFDTYAQASLPVLQAEVENPTKDVGVFALRSESGNFDAVAMATSAHIPGYQEKVLRVRHLLLSPFFDFGDYAIDAYTRVLSRMATRTITLAMKGMPSRHIKFHLRSPGDREFFAVAAEVLSADVAFYDVAIRGSWLHMSIREPQAD